MQVMPDSTLIVRAPRRVPLGLIDKMIRDKLPWILEKQRKARETYRPPRTRGFAHGEAFLCLGQWHKLCVRENPEPLSFDGREFVLSDKHVSEARGLFESWYRRYAFGVLSERVLYYARQAGLQFRNIRMTGARKRWGSCAMNGNLNFSWRLVMAPMNVVDYVVVHELAHLVEHNHSKKFWRNVELMFPEYRQAKAWLRDNHYSLDV